MTPETEETINRLLQNNILLRLKNESLRDALRECLYFGEGRGNCDKSYLPLAVRDMAYAALKE